MSRDKTNNYRQIHAGKTRIQYLAVGRRKLRPFPPYVVVKNVLNQKQIDRLVGYSNGFYETEDQGRLGRFRKYQWQPDALEWKVDNAAFPALYDIFWRIGERVNEKHYGFQLGGFDQPIQSLFYLRGDFNNWHYDYDTHDRSKLSIIVACNDGTAYQGGQIEFAEYGAVGLSTGNALVFPSFLYHRVRRVSRGCRMSVVGWLCGDNFR